MMNGNPYPQVVNKRRSFLATLVLGLSFVIATVIGSATVLGLYGMNIIDRKTGNVFELAESTIANLPELIQGLPPVLADVLNDQRRPDYAQQLEVSVSLTNDRSSKGPRAVVKIRNDGDQVVSLMSMRIVVLNDRGEVVAEMNEWGATPVAAEHDWRGPLLPGATRYFAVHHSYYDRSAGPPTGDLHVEYEITDVRVWNGDRFQTTALASAEN